MKIKIFGFFLIVLLVAVSRFLFVGEGNGERGGRETADLKSRVTQVDLKGNRKKAIDLVGDSQTEANVEMDSFATRIALASAEKDHLKRRSLIGEIAREWARKDYAGSIDWAMEIVNPGDKSAALVPIIRVMTMELGDQVAMRKAFSVMKELPEGETKDDVVVLNFSDLLNVDRESSLDLMYSLTGGGAVSYASSVFAKSLSEESDLATDYMLNSPIGEFRNKFANAYVKVLASSNPYEAYRWLQENNDFDGISDSYRAVFEGFAVQDPILGLETIEGIESENLKDKLSKVLIDSWAAEKPDEAADWVVYRISEDGFDGNSETAATVFSRWVNWDHEAAFQKLDELGDSMSRKALELKMIQSLSGRSPEIAIDKISDDFGAENDLLLVETYKSIAVNWMSKNSFEAATWVGGLEPGHSRDVALEVVVNELLTKDQDFEMAQKWIEEVSNIDLRQELMNKVKKSRLVE